MKVRQAAVEGRFYSSDKSVLFDNIDRMAQSASQIQELPGNARIIGAVLPHAAHMFSGVHTVPFFNLLHSLDERPDTFVIVNPNHTGFGPGVALDPHEYWENSVGKIALDRQMQKLLPYEEDASAQKHEHSAEVIIPFIQYFYREIPVQILPVCMRRQTFQNANALADEIYQAAKKLNRKILLIASSDFSHFLTAKKGFEKDQLVIDSLLRRDIEEVENKVNEQNLSICGYGPIMTLMSYSEKLDRQYNIEILSRGHSGESYPSEEVVDYISIMSYTTEKG